MTTVDPSDAAPPGATMLLGEMVVLDDVGRARRGRPRPSLRVSTLLLLPAGGLVAALVLYPVGRTVHASVTDPDGGFVGLEHFRTVLGRDDFGPALRHTVAWGVVVPALVTVLGYLLASASRRLPSGRTTRVVALAALVGPVGLPFVVTGVAFRLLADPDPGRGLATGVLAALFRDFESPPALLGPRFITWWLMAAFVWAWVGLAVVVFRATLDRLPPVLADTVRAHGGGALAVFRDARWHPLLRRTAALMFVLVSLATVRSFDLILTMAPGSVVDEASVLAVLQFQTSGGETTGPSAALGVIWLLLPFSGALLAVLGSRQSWPAPKAPPVPSSSSRSQPSHRHATRGSWHRRALQMAAPSLAVLWSVPLLALVAMSLHAPAQAATNGWWEPPFRYESYTSAFAADRWLVLVLGVTLAVLAVAARFAARRRLVRADLVNLALVGAVTTAVVAAALAANDELVRSGLLTLVLAATTAAAVVVMALLAAYSLAWIGSPGAHIAGIALLGAAAVPVLVIAGPLSEVVSAAGLTTSPLTLGLVHVALGLPFAVLVLRNALADLPRDEVREARLAGGGELGVIVRLLRAPSLQTAVVAVVVLQFVLVWNDFVVGLMFGGADTVPLTVLVHDDVPNFVTSSGPLAATAVAASLVPVTVVALTYRWIVAGLIGSERSANPPPTAPGPHDTETTEPAAP